MTIVSPMRTYGRFGTRSRMRTSLEPPPRRTAPITCGFVTSVAVTALSLSVSSVTRDA